jgi:RND family efflux transporter MFP subunit
MEAQHVRERHLAARIILANGSLYPETGTIDFASNAVDPSTGTIQVRASFPNEKRALTPGLFVRLQVASEQAYAALLIPERAINTDQSDKFVFVVDDKKMARRKNVKLGTKHGKLRVVTQGLEPGDKVVISGGLLVRPDEEVQPAIGKIDADLANVAVTNLKPTVINPSPSQANSGQPGADSVRPAVKTHPPAER